jgi:hypothetical protein
VLKHVRAVAVSTVFLLSTTGCSSSGVTHPWADPRTHKEYSDDRNVCLQKHTFAVVGAPSGQCLHCELFTLCMKTRFWQTDPKDPSGGSLSCCPGTQIPPP